MDQFECKICGKDFKSIECQTICDKCQIRILKIFNIEIKKDGSVVPSDKEIIVTLIWNISNMWGYVNYLIHAIEHHTHSKKEVEVINID